jgi:hypothetical protein
LKAIFFFLLLGLSVSVNADDGTKISYVYKIMNRNCTLYIMIWPKFENGGTVAQVLNVVHQKLAKSTPTCNPTYLPEDLSTVVFEVSHTFKVVKFSTHLKGQLPLR